MAKENIFGFPFINGQELHAKTINQICDRLHKTVTHTAGSNINIDIDGKISATDTTYTADDFDIKDLSDSTHLMRTWNNKQDKLEAGSNITIENGIINATDTKYTAGTGIKIVGNEISVISDKNEVNSGTNVGGGDSSNVTTNLIKSITWDGLYGLCQNDELIPGTIYRLIDYQCTVDNDSNARAINKGLFDILIVADDESTLNENVRFTYHDGDEYFSGCNLESWEGKYCIYNDTTRFTWATRDNTGKGVIYWLKDEWGNECPYDFKHIQFKRTVDGVDNWYYTFTWVDENDVVKDVSVVGQKLSTNNGHYSGVFNNQILPVSECKSHSCNGNKYRIVLNNIVFISSYSYSGAFNGCYGNKFGVNCYNNTFGNYCNCNTLGSECYNNTFGNGCANNILGNLCYGNTFGGECSYNTFGNWCSNNSSVNNCYDNTFGNYCNNNTLGNDCNGNTFGNYCDNNTFETDYMYDCRFGDSVQYCTISGYTTSISNCLKNIIVLNGTQGTMSNKLNLGVVDDVMVFEENIGAYGDITPSLVCGYTRDKDNQILYVVKDYFIPVLI